MTAEEKARLVALIEAESQRRARACYLRATDGMKLMGLEVHMENEFLAMAIYAIGQATGQAEKAQQINREAGQS